MKHHLRTLLFTPVVTVLLGLSLLPGATLSPASAASHNWGDFADSYNGVKARPDMNSHVGGPNYWQFRRSATSTHRTQVRVAARERNIATGARTGWRTNTSGIRPGSSIVLKSPFLNRCYPHGVDMRAQVRRRKAGHWTKWHTVNWQSSTGFFC